MSLEELKTALPKPDQLSPAEIEAKAESLGVSKSKMGFIQSFMLSIMAGAFISMGAMFFLLIVSDSALPFAAQRLIGGCLFSLGLLLVVVCGAELFTGNTMIVMSAASRKITWLAVLKNWLVVFFGNFVGALIMVGLVYLSNFQSMNGGAVGTAIVSVAAGKMTPDWLTLFAKGIMCNFLVCLAVWMAFCAASAGGKVISLYGPIFIFVLCGFEHSVANMYYIPAGIFLCKNGELSWLSMVQNLLPVTLGNLVGGCALGCILYLLYGRKSA